MTPTIGIEAFVDVVKLAAIVFAFLHFGVVLMIFRQIVLLNSKIRTSHGGCLRLLTLMHILLLSGIILIIVFI